MEYISLKNIHVAIFHLSANDGDATRLSRSSVSMDYEELRTTERKATTSQVAERVREQVSEVRKKISQVTQGKGSKDFT